MLLILDLDETLIRGTYVPLERPADLMADDIHVYDRPHVREFLAYCLREFRTAVWTSGNAAYAADVVGHLFGPDPDLAFVWARPRCTREYDWEYRREYYSKNLKKVLRLGFDPARILAVDNTPRKWRRSYGNLIAVKPYYGDLADEELPALMAYLETLKDCPNVRAVEKRGWRRFPTE
jgi:TFIIF-interacting CTD phosphatase-like protein